MLLHNTFENNYFIEQAILKDMINEVVILNFNLFLFYLSQPAVPIFNFTVMN